MRVSHETRVAGVKLLIFSLVSLFVTSVLVAIMGKLGTGDTGEYHAIFANASMVMEGDEVRVAGVPMGKVTGVEIYERDRAKVSFTFKKELALTEASRVEIRYLNVVGERYISVLQGKPGAPELDEGDTITPGETIGQVVTARDAYNVVAPHGGRIIELAARQQLPAIYSTDEMVHAGGLMAYGADLRTMYRQGASHIDRILRGAKPAELPIEQPTKFELVINTRTARALGLVLPRSLLLRADEVVD